MQDIQLKTSLLVSPSPHWQETTEISIESPLILEDLWERMFDTQRKFPASQKKKKDSRSEGPSVGALS